MIDDHDVSAEGIAESNRPNADNGHVQFAHHERPVATTREGYEALGHERMSPLQAIRQKCLDCSAGSYKEISLCRSIKCDLLPFRMGTNPWRQRREITAEQRDALTLRLIGGRNGSGDQSDD
jgi:hypothetical protein